MAEFPWAFVDALLLERGPRPHIPELLRDRLSDEHVGDGRLSDVGLRARPFDAADRDATSEAERVIAGVPSVERLALDLVGSVGVLEVEDDDYDQSHSAPELGRAVFVSIPRRQGLRGIRLAEGLLHETFHLQLGLLEDQISLVGSHDPVRSPWRATDRPPGGVLHGLYVFACLHRVFDMLSSTGDLAETTHCHQRMVQIRAEVLEVDLSKLTVCLTPTGNELVRNVMTGLTPRRR